MTDYTGVVMNLQISQKTSGAGKTYNLHAFNLDGIAKPFQGVYLQGIRLQNGMKITLSETPGPKGPQYSAVEAGNDNSGMQGSSPAPSTPVSSYGRSPNDQSRISRQWAINAGIEVASKLEVPTSKKKGAADAALINVIGHYAAIFYAAAQSDEALKALGNYNGNIGEIGDDALPEDMQG